MPRSKRSKRVTPQRVKTATRQILADAEMLRRVRHVESMNKTRRNGETFPSYSVSKSALYDQKSAPTPGVIASVVRTRGMKDLTFDFNATVASVTIGNGTAGTNDALYWRVVDPVSGSGAITDVLPIVPGMWVPSVNGGYGVPYVYDIEKYYRFKRFLRLQATIEPYGVGALTGSGITLAVAPRAGGGESFTCTTGSLPPLSALAVRGLKGAIEFPMFQSVGWDLMPYVMAPGTSETGSKVRFTTHANGVLQSSPTLNLLGVPCAMMIGGTSGTQTAAWRGATVGILTISGTMVCEDFQGPFIEANIAQRTEKILLGDAPRSGDEKEPAPRSVLADRGQNPPPPPPPLRRTEPGDTKCVDFVDPVALPTSSYLMSGGTFTEWKRLSERERLVWLSDDGPRNVKRGCSAPAPPVSVVQ